MYKKCVRRNLNAYSRHILANNENKKYALRKQRQSLPYKSFPRFSHKSIDKKLEQFQDFLQTNLFWHFYPTKIPTTIQKIYFLYYV